MIKEGRKSFDGKRVDCKPEKSKTFNETFGVERLGLFFENIEKTRLKQVKKPHLYMKNSEWMVEIGGKMVVYQYLKTLRQLYLLFKIAKVIETNVSVYSD